MDKVFNAKINWISMKGVEILRHYMKNFINQITNIYRTCMSLVFPHHCPFCDGIVTPFGENIHAECISKFKLQTPPYCMKCGKKVSEDEMYCSDCKKQEHEFVRGRMLYVYRDAAPSIYRYKYAHRKEYAQYYGDQIVKLLGSFIRQVNPDALVPIPIHRKRMEKRGFNQAQELAKAISKRIGIPVDGRLLKRRKNTIPLKVLGISERRENLKNAFTIGRNSVKLKTIIIVDDIYTTGATIDEATRVLHEAGVRDVYFVTLAGGTDE